MHTPTHAALNFLVLGRDPGSPRLWIVMGAVLPDVPMFGFFLYERFVRGEATRRIFQDLYFEPHWQTLFDVSHSIPLFLLFAAFFWWRRSSTGLLFAISLLLHSLVDWPTHLEDAHAYFWPIWREPLRGVVSYWHGGSPLWALELGIIFLAVSWMTWETASRRRPKGIRWGVD
jgi:hypothetical protein